MRTRCFIDVQTASKADLKKSGSGYYASHESTRVLFLTYCFDYEAVVRWEPMELDPFPEELEEYLGLASGEVWFWFDSFGVDILERTLGLKVKAKVKGLNNLARRAGFPTAFTDFYRQRISFAPYSLSEVDIGLYIKRFCVDGEDPFDGINSVSFSHFKGACVKRVWAYREIHHQCDLKVSLSRRQEMLDSVI